jgi:C_GCAxxG_C_C family probable redox protein
MEKSTEEILNMVFENAKKYEIENGNCAQCVIAAVFETLGIKNDDVFRAASGFADGVGLTGDGHCGALSGGTIAISYFFGRKKEDFNKREKMIKSLILSKKLYEGFIEKYGTCRCADIQTKLVGRSFNFYDPADTEAAIKAGLPGKCSILTAEAARLTTKIILEQRGRESQKAKKGKPQP